MSESDRLKRLRMRSWRRGTKEMDLILGPWADEMAAGLAAGELDVYEALLNENDHDLYQWVTARIGSSGGASAGASGAQSRGPSDYARLMDRIAAHAAARLAGRTA